MVSRFQRHLSLFLVVITATSWLVMPANVQAQSSSQFTEFDVTEDAETEAPTAAEIAAERAANTRLARDFFTNNHNFSNTPAFTNFGFSLQSDGTITHRFKVLFNGKTNPSTEPTYEQSFKPVEGVTIWGGCQYRLDKSPTCSKDNPKSYNLFTRQKITRKAQVATEGDPHEIWQETYSQLQTYQFSDNAIRPELYLLRNGTILYGFYEYMGNDNNAAIYWQPLLATGPNKPFGYYVNYVNCRNNFQWTNGCTPTHTLRTGSSDSDDQASETSEQDTINLFAQWFDPEASNRVKNSQFKLQDNPTGQDKPPVVIVSAKDAEGNESTLPYDFTFILEEVLGAKFGWWSNNYFVFSLTKESVNAITDADIKALIDPTKIYLVIDLSGNISIIKSERSTIDRQKYTILRERPNTEAAEGSEEDLNEYIIAGQFDGDNQVSPFIIDIDEYRNVITKRVYNEQYLEQGNGGKMYTVKVGDAWCDPNGTILYPQTNKTYDDYLDPNRTSFNADGGVASSSSFHAENGIPNKEHRQCVNDVEGTWLAKWKAELNALGGGSKDACTEAFNGGFWSSMLIVKPLCGALAVITAGAIFLAHQMITFFVEAVGLEIYDKI